MTAIAPTYYASGRTTRTFTLTGSGFENIPEDAVGVMSTNNEDPLQFRYDTRPLVLASVAINSDSEVVVNNGNHEFSNPSYLGAILSADRTIVYWVNETRPLQ